MTNKEIWKWQSEDLLTVGSYFNRACDRLLNSKA
jgi:hypothetical protein